MVTFLIPTYNAGIKLEWCLRSITDQNFVKTKVIIIDGGSTDNTLEIAKGYDCQILHNPFKLAEYGVQIGMKYVKSEFICIFAADNEFYDNTCLFRVTRIFKVTPGLSAIWGRLVSANWDSNLNKYFELIQSDPLNWFLNNNLQKYLKEKFIFQVKPDKPLVWGANGLIYRTNKIKHIWEQKGYLGDNDAFQTMIEQGNNIVAYLDTPFVYHHHVGTLRDWIKKWQRNTRSHLLSKQGTRNMRWVMNKDFKWKLCLWLIYSFCPIFSGIDALWRIIYYKNIYWIYHPICCFIQTLVYTTELVKWKIKKLWLVFRSVRFVLPRLNVKKYAKN